MNMLLPRQRSDASQRHSVTGSHAGTLQVSGRAYRADKGGEGSGPPNRERPRANPELGAAGGASFNPRGGSIPSKFRQRIISQTLRMKLPCGYVMYSYS